MMKKLINLLLAIGMILALTGCSGNGPKVGEELKCGDYSVTVTSIETGTELKWLSGYKDNVGIGYADVSKAGSSFGLPNNDNSAKNVWKAESGKTFVVLDIDVKFEGKSSPSWPLTPHYMKLNYGKDYSFEVYCWLYDNNGWNVQLSPSYEVLSDKVYKFRAIYCVPEIVVSDEKEPLSLVIETTSKGNAITLR